MNDFLNQADKICRILNSYIWGTPMVLLMAGVGILMTVGTHFFQFVHIREWMSKSIGSIFSKKQKNITDKDSISPFQALCTALAATIGTGNIAGVAMAVSVGGAGAVFWMWVSAFLGMMTAYAENVLGIRWRFKKNGKLQGGPMYYMEYGIAHKLKKPIIGKCFAVIFSFFCIFASFGMGNLVQINSISVAMESEFGISTVVISCIVAVLVSVVIIGGTAGIGRFTEKMVPLMASLYIAGTLAFFVMNYREIPRVFSTIFTSAFSGEALTGSVCGIVSKKTVEIGFKRGVFSNEAGIGSAALAHSASSESEPAVQGMWGIFAVFFDTVVICTLTAFVILSCTTDAVSVYDSSPDSSYACIDNGCRSADGKQVLLISDKENPVTGYTNIVVINDGHTADDAQSGVNLTDCQKLEGVDLVTFAFSQKFGRWAGKLVAAAIFMFAFSTVIGWSFFGVRAWEYLFGSRFSVIYKLVFVSLIIVGGSFNMELIWNIADTFNGLMAVPNLITLVLLSGTVFEVTKKCKF